MKKIFVLLLLLCVGTSVFAQEGDPDENACYVGGTMEGQCNGDINQDGEVTQYEIDWAWNCGWYVAHYNSGAIGRYAVPSWCNILLPSLWVAPLDSNTTGFVCGVFFVYFTECLRSGYLMQDYGSDGSFEWAWYVVSDDTYGGNSCPVGTFYDGDIKDYEAADASFYQWVLANGFKASDDFCSSR